MFTIQSFGKARQAGTPLVLMTCYDAPGAKALEESSVDAVLVGDSVAMVVHGYDSTISATVDMIEAHVRAVRAGGPQLFIIADMPFLSTRTGTADGVRAAGRLMQAGANAVKIEGLVGHEDLIPQLIGSGIPVMGHLGLQPQSVNVYGSYQVQGKTHDASAQLLAEARALEHLGCFSLVLECVPPDVAAHVTQQITIPTIGIGAGAGCSGQILVYHDLLGLPARSGAKMPRFVRQYRSLGSEVSAAASAWAQDVREGRFPRPQEAFAPLQGRQGQAAGRQEPHAGLVVIEDPQAWKSYCRSLAKGGSIGFVPTMGALHQGHASLVRRSAAENDCTLVSIFVNPTQFNDPKDLAAYPRTLEADCALLAEAGATAVFLPTKETMYPDDFAYQVSEGELSKRFCGAFRPGHFDGVLTVVLKLLQLTGAERAYFGEKDWQQYQLIRGMARAFFLDTEIVGCPTVREPSGLAMSSRNTRLSAQGLDGARFLFQALHESPDCATASARLEAAGFKPEYVEDLADPFSGKVRRLAAAWLEGVRLIDNVELGAEARAGLAPTGLASPVRASLGWQNAGSAARERVSPEADGSAARGTEP